jgi:hypothetical protein
MVFGPIYSTTSCIFFLPVTTVKNKVYFAENPPKYGKLYKKGFLDVRMREQSNYWSQRLFGRRISWI